MYSQPRNGRGFPSPASTSGSSNHLIQDNILDILNISTGKERAKIPSLSESISESLPSIFDLNLCTFQTTSTSPSSQPFRELENIENRNLNLPYTSPSNYSLIHHDKLYTFPEQPSQTSPSISTQDSSPIPYSPENQETPALDTSKALDLFAYLGVQFDAEPIITYEDALAEFESSCREILEGSSGKIMMPVGKV